MLWLNNDHNKGPGKSTQPFSANSASIRASRRGGVVIRWGAEIRIHSAENGYVDLPLPTRQLKVWRLHWNAYQAIKDRTDKFVKSAVFSIDPCFSLCFRWYPVRHKDQLNSSWFKCFDENLPPLEVNPTLAPTDKVKVLVHRPYAGFQVYYYFRLLASSCKMGSIKPNVLVLVKD